MNEPFFFGMDNDDMLVKITKVLGTKELIEYLSKYNLQIEKKLLKRCKNFQK